MKLEEAGTFFCYKITTEDRQINYIIARSINLASTRASRRTGKVITNVEFVGEGLP